MVIALAVIFLFIISFVWALWSLRKESQRIKEVDETRKELSKEKILFKV